MITGMQCEPALGPAPASGFMHTLPQSSYRVCEAGHEVTQEWGWDSMPAPKLLTVSLEGN